MRILGTVSLMAALISHCSAPTPPTPPAPQLSVPAIGLTHDIVVGDQHQIDLGNVVNYGHDDTDGCWPGQGCTVWIAGHRTTHGGVFRQIPDLVPGDELSIAFDGATFTYVVTETEFVSRVNPPPDFMHGDVMIQTSWTHGDVLLVYADGV